MADIQAVNFNIWVFAQGYYESYGGFCEDKATVTFTAVDLCLRVKEPFYGQHGLPK